MDFSGQIVYWRDFPKEKTFRVMIFYMKVNKQALVLIYYSFVEGASSFLHAWYGSLLLDFVVSISSSRLNQLW